MVDNPTAPDGDTPQIGPLTIGTVRDQHLALMREWRELPGDAERAALATALREAVAQSGSDIESAAERDEAQGIIDYWASAIAALPGQSYPPLLTVAPYRGESAKVAARSVREVYDGLSPPATKLLARKVLESLLTVRSGTVERGRPRDRETLRTSAGANDPAVFDAVLEQLVETGAIVLRPGENRDDDCFEAADARIAEAWPDLAEWLRESATYTAERNRLMELAQKWEAANRDPTLLLLTSQAAVDALSFRGEDDLLDDFINASNRVRTSARRLMTLAAVLAILVLGAASAYLWWQLGLVSADKTNSEQNLAKANQQLAMANAERVTATQVLTSAKEDATFVSDNNNTEYATQVAQAAVVEPAYAQTDGADPVSALPGVSGAMWLGSDDAPQVTTLDSLGQVGKFRGASPGTRYRARAPIYMRQFMPSLVGEYLSPPKKAIIPAGGQIVLLGAPRAYDRPSGVQYWAQVRVVPQVYVQYNANMTKGEVDRIRRELAAIGFEVPPAQLIRGFAGLSEVRFQRPEDNPIATLLQERLETLPQVRERGRVGCQLLPVASSLPSNFKLEFWFDPRRSARQDDTKPCPVQR